MSENGQGDELLLQVASAMWNVGQGYGVEDVQSSGDEGKIVDWHPDNADDVADRAMHVGHARQVLAHLLAAGWTPPAPAVAPKPIDPDDGGPCALWYRDDGVFDEFLLCDDEAEAAGMAVAFEDAECPSVIDGVQFPDGRLVPARAWARLELERKRVLDRRRSTPALAPTLPVLRTATSPFTGAPVKIEDAEWNLPWIGAKEADRG